MKIFMVGEAMRYRRSLAAGLNDEVSQQSEIVSLPREAAATGDFDVDIGPQDVVISLRFRRDGGEAPPFRLLHVPGAGLDGIDFDALSDRTTVCNVFEHEGPISEFVLASILQWEIRLDELRSSFSPEKWSDIYRNRVPHGELHGKTLGIIGFGRIGRAIAARAKSFGVTVMTVDPAPISADSPADEIFPAGDLPRFLGKADYVIVACPLSERTRGLIGERELELMKSSAVVINISRADIINEKALFHALREEGIKGANLDVWYRYPSSALEVVYPSRYPFHELANAVCTPHSSAWTTELMERRYAVIARNLNALTTGEPLENVVRQGRR